MYKDPDKQREANRQASQRQRDKKGMTDDCAKAGIVIPDHPVPVIPAEPEVMVEIDNDGNITPISQPKRGKDIKRRCSSYKIVNDGPITILEAKPKRGKDIKCFEDLPPDVQRTIDKMGVVDGKIDQIIKVNRTAIAIHYQHLFPDRFHSTGVAI